MIGIAVNTALKNYSKMRGYCYVQQIISGFSTSDARYN